MFKNVTKFVEMGHYNIAECGHNGMELHRR